jgi:hypothetical protein
LRNHGNMRRNISIKWLYRSGKEMATIFIPSFTCPHCLTKCSFLGEGSKDTFVLWCNGCHKGVYFRFRDIDLPLKYDQLITLDIERIEDYYPRKAVAVDASIPKEIADDYVEAARCIDVSAPKATVAMCRRTLQGACVLRGANPKVDLVDQIDELESKRVINPGLKDIAHAVRMIGNWDTSGKFCRKRMKQGRNSESNSLKLSTANSF